MSLKTFPGDFVGVGLEFYEKRAEILEFDGGMGRKNAEIESETIMKKSDLVIVQDTREQMPLVFTEAAVEVATLTTGDYSLKGFEDKVCIERKSLPDLLQSLGVDRDRFMREVHRMRAYEFAGLVVEADMTTIYRGGWRSQITPQSVIGSLQALSAKYGIHVLLADNRELAAKTIEGILYHFLRKQFEYYERLKPLLQSKGTTS